MADYDKNKVFSLGIAHDNGLLPCSIDSGIMVINRKTLNLNFEEMNIIIIYGNNQEIHFKANINGTYTYESHENIEIQNIKSEDMSLLTFYKTDEFCPKINDDDECFF